MKTREKLLEIMGQYTTDNVIIPADQFEDKLEKVALNKDWRMEGYTKAEKDDQRKYSKEFHWGHNHDFGTFQLTGVLGDRHIDLIETFVDAFGLPLDLTGKRVLDVGAWCGGTSLLLAGMGGKVETVEEVKKYQNCLRFLSRMFGLKRSKTGTKMTDYPCIHVKKGGVYSINNQEWFDYIIFPGVLYHLSDPLVALRILFNALKDGGELYVETKLIPKFDIGCENAYLEFDAGRGNNWFTPDPEAMHKMAKVVGFEFVDAAWDKKNDTRAFCKYRRNEWKPMLKAGLSRRVR